MTDPERRLAELAAYHVGLFTFGVRYGVATGMGATPAEIAHALFLLAEEARLRREQWITSERPAP